MNRDMDPAGLEPCPFCGGEPSLTSGGPGNHYVRCMTCHATSNDGVKDSAIAAWNRRAARSAPQPAVKGLTHDGAPLTLADCPIGLFISHGGELCLKTEYRNNEGRIDAYIVSTGEFFWGTAPQTINSQRSQVVQPVAIIAPFLDTEPVEGEPVAWQDVIAERQRQVSVEGWSPDHDDAHDRGEMAYAAACYAVSRRILEGSTRMSERGLVRSLWPWDLKWWKPKDQRRNLVKAGALILAEIERLDRAAKG